jgi:hypothetical protein
MINSARGQTQARDASHPILAQVQLHFRTRRRRGLPLFSYGRRMSSPSKRSSPTASMDRDQIRTAGNSSTAKRTASAAVAKRR